jgi:hypothetical protein
VSNRKNRIKYKIFICSLLTAAIPNPVIASVGFYPIEKGEVLRAEACVPKNTKPPISLQLNNGHGKPISVATINSIPKSTGKCSKNERQMFINWKVDRPGIYGLSFHSTKSKLTFFGWPDGIEVTRG